MSEAKKRKFGKKVWRTTETDQGRAFISDSIVGMDDDKALEVAENALRHVRRVERTLSELIYDEKERRKKAKSDILDHPAYPNTGVV